MDLFTVLTIDFRVLYVFLVLAHERHRILHFGVTAHPAAEWAAQQLREAFPWESAPRFLLRDPDRNLWYWLHQAREELEIEELLGAPGAPQHAYIGRVIGTMRRGCLDPVIVFNEASWYRHPQLFPSIVMAHELLCR